MYTWTHPVSNPRWRAATTRENFANKLYLRKEGVSTEIWPVLGDTYSVEFVLPDAMKNPEGRDWPCTATGTGMTLFKPRFSGILRDCAAQLNSVTALTAPSSRSDTTGVMLAGAPLLPIIAQEPVSTPLMLVAPSVAKAARISLLSLHNVTATIVRDTKSHKTPETQMLGTHARTRRDDEVVVGGGAVIPTVEAHRATVVVRRRRVCG